MGVVVPAYQGLVYMDTSTDSVVSFFGLREPPFAATADPAYFFSTPHHKECLFRLWNMIEERQGTAVVLGGYGTGKTTILRKLLSEMRTDTDTYNTGVIPSPLPSWTSSLLAENIAHKFMVRLTDSSLVSCMELLSGYLTENRARVTTLIIDEAQNLNKRGQLELLRLLHNLETRQHKLLNIVCFAQPEWVPILRAVPNFADRIHTTVTLKLLSLDELVGLIEFRLGAAGAGADEPVFEEDAIRVIHAYSGGAPRAAVNLCRNVLVLAAQLKTRRIGSAIVMHTIQSATLPDSEKQARVAAALRARRPASPQLVPASEEERRVSSPSRARANQLLLRAARSPRSQPPYPRKP